MVAISQDLPRSRRDFTPATVKNRDRVSAGQEQGYGEGSNESGAADSENLQKASQSTGTQWATTLIRSASKNPDADLVHPSFCAKILLGAEAQRFRRIIFLPSFGTTDWYGVGIYVRSS